MKMFAPVGFFRGMSDEQLSDLADPRREPTVDLPTIMHHQGRGLAVRAA